MLPTGITLTTVTFGTALTNVSRTELAMRVTFTPTSNLVWAATGTVIIGITESATNAAVSSGSVNLIDPWQSGFVDGNGYQIVNWGYKVKADYVDPAGNTVLSTTEKIITWTASTVGPIDLDLLVPVPTQSGIIVYLPDAWSASIANLTTRVTALEAGGTGSGSGTAGGFLSGSYPNPGVNLTALDTAVAGRVNLAGTATRTAILALIGTGSTTADLLLLESGDFLVTEAGDFITL